MQKQKLEKIEEIRVRCQCFHSYFHHIICTHNCYYFDPNNPRLKYGYLLLHRQYKADQVTLPLVIGLDETWDTKLLGDPTQDSSCKISPRKSQKRFLGKFPDQSVCVFVCFRPPVSIPLNNYEVVGFQPQSVYIPDLGSVHPPPVHLNPLLLYLPRRVKLHGHTDARVCARGQIYSITKSRAGSHGGCPLMISYLLPYMLLFYISYLLRKN